MEKLELPSTPTTPFVQFDSNNGELKISGRSTPEHPASFYIQLNSWIDQYIQDPAKITNVEMYFEYFNTSSSKYILELLRKLVTVKVLGVEIYFRWYYENEDEDMRDAGSDYSELLDIPFELIAKEVS